MKFQALTLGSLLALAVQGMPAKRASAEAAGSGCTAAAPATGAAANTGNAAAAPAANTSALVLPDGRIKKDAVATDFNVLASVFKSAVVKGEGLQFSDLIIFPDVTPSLFDTATNTKAFEITINDSSIFTPKGGEPQSNIRRADLLPSIRSALNNVATTGIRTMHFSVQPDAARPLNLTHDYQIVNLESADFSFHQFDVRTGGTAGENIVVNGNSKTAGGATTLFTTPFTKGTFQNFALKMDFTASTMQVFHSTGNEPLKQVTEPLTNDLTGNGEYHFALQKNAIGETPQETGINEGIIFGGIFMEDSTAGTVTLQ